MFDEPGEPGAHDLDPPRCAPQAVWVRITPFGAEGPRSTWRASDLGVMASSGNMYCTGDPDRAPIRSTEPTGYAHSGPEAAFAAMTALASGLPQRVDFSMQEVVLIANMAAPGRYPDTKLRGSRRGANIGRTREIWPTVDGYVSFGLRGGKARIPSLEILTKLVAGDGIDADALVNRDWNDFNQNTATDEDLAAIEVAVAEYFSRHTMQELYDIACETNLMLAPANSPREIYASAQLAARDFFGPVGDIARFPQSFVRVLSPGNEVATVKPASGVRTVERARFTAKGRRATGGTPGRRAWEGLKIIEFGSGAAGPIATRYFVENGATVLRVESKTRPDFLRAYSSAPGDPNGLEFSTMYDGLNVGKKNVALNLKKPESIALGEAARHRVVRRGRRELRAQGDEGIRPRLRDARRDQARSRDDQRVPQRSERAAQGLPRLRRPGLGARRLQRAHRLARPRAGRAVRDDHRLARPRDSSPPRSRPGCCTTGAPARASTSTSRRSSRPTGRCRRGCSTTRSTVCCACATATGTRTWRRTARSVAPTKSGIADRWVAIACRTDDDWRVLASIIGADASKYPTLVERKLHEDEVEALVTAWTKARTRAEVAQTLQANGIEAVPVEDFADLHDDPQLALRKHFEPHTHAFLGPGLYERNGFRMSDAPGGYDQAGPTLGQDSDWVLRDLLGCTDADDRGSSKAAGAVEYGMMGADGRPTGHPRRP